MKSNYSFEAPLYKVASSLGLAEKKNIELDSFNLSKFLISNPQSTYLVRVVGDSMIDENIYEGDILVVNKDEKPTDGKVVIAALNGEMTVKTLRVIESKVYLFSANKRFLPMEILPFWEFEIQGVVKHVIKSL
ncbi:MAG: S24 family peptidase [bacterium]